MRRFLAFLLMSLTSLQAFATLGEGSKSIDAQKIQKLSNYSVAETTTDPNTGLATVKEFKDSSDKVFGVCWLGQRPQSFIAQLLGSTYMERYHQAVQSAPKHKGQKILTVKTGNFVLRTLDHGRSHRGCAYDPTLVPSGVNTNEIR